ncbi:MAG: hypothetical protein AMJ84_09645 [Acidithiobacillales bacterium SM23_46]|nr:MAG: hypothetical protein AMJ84_09645 [Acidithiobacillales bacterium SM23_46]
MDETEKSLGSQELLPGEEERAKGLVRLAALLLPFAGLTLVIIPFAVFAEGFLSVFNFKLVVIQTVVIAIAALGMTFVIISGGIDLSVGSVIALATVAVALPLELGHPAWVAALCGIGTAGLCGLLNGLMITGLRIVPFIATLGMLGIARGVAKLLAGEQKIDAPETWLNDLMLKIPKDEWLALEPSWFQRIPEAFRDAMELIVLSPGLWMLLATVVVIWLLLGYTTFGRYTSAIGSNEPTARLCGVRVNMVKVGIYTLAGLLTGLAGLLQFSRLTVGDPTVSVGAELDVIAAVVIGGGSLSGGEGSIVGTLIGALAMAFLRNGCDLLGWGNYVQEIFIGIFIVIFVAIDQIRRARTAT